MTAINDRADGALRFIHPAAAALAATLRAEAAVSPSAHRPYSCHRLRAQRNVNPPPRPAVPPRSLPAPHLYVTAGSSRCSRRASRTAAGGLSPRGTGFGGGGRFGSPSPGGQTPRRPQSASPRYPASRGGRSPAGAAPHPQQHKRSPGGYQRHYQVWGRAPRGQGRAEGGSERRAEHGRGWEWAAAPSSGERGSHRSQRRLTSVIREDGETPVRKREGAARLPEAWYQGTRASFLLTFWHRRMERKLYTSQNCSKRLCLLYLFLFNLFSLKQPGSTVFFLPLLTDVVRAALCT